VKGYLEMHAPQVCIITIVQISDNFTFQDLINIYTSPGTSLCRTHCRSTIFQHTLVHEKIFIDLIKESSWLTWHHLQHQQSIDKQSSNSSDLIRVLSGLVISWPQAQEK
jgi:hypothetical protein